MHILLFLQEYLRITKHFAKIQASELRSTLREAEKYAYRADFRYLTTLPITAKAP